LPTLVATTREGRGGAAMRTCEACGSPFPVDAEFCPVCAAPAPAVPARSEPVGAPVPAVPDAPPVRASWWRRLTTSRGRPAPSSPGAAPERAGVPETAPQSDVPVDASPPGGRVGGPPVLPGDPPPSGAPVLG